MNLQKGVGDVMRGPLIETEARRLRDEATVENARKTATRMLQDDELSVDKIAKYTGLNIAEIEQLKKQLA